jgi:hypothetical protein
MRKKLAAESGNRKKFSAVFERLGKKVNFKGYSEETILLKNITDLETNVVLTDHVWFSFTQGFIKASLAPGDRVEFEARVKEYKKGYVNRSLKINDSAIDYKLSNPTKIKRLNA